MQLETRTRHAQLESSTTREMTPLKLSSVLGWVLFCGFSVLLSGEAHASTSTPGSAVDAPFFHVMINSKMISVSWAASPEAASPKSKDREKRESPVQVQDLPDGQKVVKLGQPMELPVKSSGSGSCVGGGKCSVSPAAEGSVRVSGLGIYKPNNPKELVSIATVLQSLEEQGLLSQWWAVAWVDDGKRGSVGLVMESDISTAQRTGAPLALFLNEKGTLGGMSDGSPLSQTVFAKAEALGTNDQETFRSAFPQFVSPKSYWRFVAMAQLFASTNSLGGPMFMGKPKADKVTLLKSMSLIPKLFDECKRDLRPCSEHAMWEHWITKDKTTRLEYALSLLDVVDTLNVKSFTEIVNHYEDVYLAWAARSEEVCGKVTKKKISCDDLRSEVAEATSEVLRTFEAQHERSSRTALGFVSSLALDVDMLKLKDLEPVRQKQLKGGKKVEPLMKELGRYHVLILVDPSITTGSPDGDLTTLAELAASYASFPRTSLVTVAVPKSQKEAMELALRERMAATSYVEVVATSSDATNSERSSVFFGEDVVAGVLSKAKKQSKGEACIYEDKCQVPIFIVDQPVTVPMASVETSFSLWRASPDRVVSLGSILEPTSTGDLDSRAPQSEVSPAFSFFSPDVLGVEKGSSDKQRLTVKCQTLQGIWEHIESTGKQPIIARPSNWRYEEMPTAAPDTSTICGGKEVSFLDSVLNEAGGSAGAVHTLYTLDAHELPFSLLSLEEDSKAGEQMAFISWGYEMSQASPSSKEGKVYKSIQENLVVDKKITLTWEAKPFLGYLHRFYGREIHFMKQKLEECGDGQSMNPFELFYVRPMQRKYVWALSREYAGHTIPAIVDWTVFKTKISKREVLGRNCLHASMSEDEFAQDIHFLLSLNGGRNVEGPIHSAVVPASTGSFKDLVEAFSVLNYATNYVVLRNFENLPESHVYAGRADVDLLVKNREAARLALKGTDNEEWSTDVSVGGETISFDLYEVGDGYFDKRWGQAILGRRVWEKDAFYRVSDVDYFWTMFYHALVKKKTIIAQDYLDRLQALYDRLPHKFFPGISRRVLESPNKDLGFPVVDKYLSSHGYTIGNLEQWKRWIDPDAFKLLGSEEQSVYGDRGKFLFTQSLVLDGKPYSIHLYERDNPRDLAFDFAKQIGAGNDLLQFVEQQLHIGKQQGSSVGVIEIGPGD